MAEGAGEGGRESVREAEGAGNERRADLAGCAGWGGGSCFTRGRGQVQALVSVQGIWVHPGILEKGASYYRHLTQALTRLPLPAGAGADLAAWAYVKRMRRLNLTGKMQVSVWVCGCSR